MITQFIWLIIILNIKMLSKFTFISWKLANAIKVNLPLTQQTHKTDTIAKEQNTFAFTAKKVNKMISSEQKEALSKRVVGGASDYNNAAEIYQALTGLSITPRYLYKFITGERKVTGAKPGSHNPVDLYEALVEAVTRREKKESEMKARAKALTERLAA